MRRLAAILAVILGMGGVSAATPAQDLSRTPTAQDLRQTLAAERLEAAQTARALRRQIRRERRELRAARRRHEPDVEGALALAAAVYGVPRGEIRAVAFCESRLRPWARNASGASGLMQFMPGTFAGTPPGRAGLSVFDPYANALAAGWLWSRSGWSHWTCRP